MARLGDDPAAEVARAAFARFGLPVDAVETVPDRPTGIAQITVSASGENTIVVTSGANADLGPAAVDAVRDLIASADVVLTQGELPVPTIDALARACAAAGTRLVLNLAPPVAVDAATLAVADPLVVNAHEARTLGLGVDLAPDASAEAWRDVAVSAAGDLARSVVITLGALGAVAADGSGATVVHAPAVEAVDTTGAGDAATGALVAMLAEGHPLGRALLAGAAAGAIAVQAHGTVDSYGTRDDVLALASRLEEDR
ncbi:hypothetical protein GCM10009819_17910 [Agromyces tropicus]|uniref:Carbohydrate kinase PfkB domain-containing protein n=1 Tax=Agromyces tropicus TaxID=555371 RepID=A0ABN2UDE0_9MICO